MRGAESKRSGLNRGRPCIMCRHPDRAVFEEKLLSGELSQREAARLMGCGQASVQRHMEHHVPRSVREAILAGRVEGEIEHGSRLLEQARDLQRRTLAILAAAEGAGDHSTALKAIREARGNLELLARLLGELGEGQTVNVLVMPEWWTVRRVLLEALAPFPEARVAAALALKEVDGGDASF